MGPFVSILYPIILLFAIKFFQVDFDDVLVMRFVPLFISVYFTILLIFSYKNENRFILNFALKFFKNIDKKEQTYIQKTTLYWIGICLINIFLHVVFIYQTNPYYWATYTSFGWYMVFFVGGVMQFLYRKIAARRIRNV